MVVGRGPYFLAAHWLVLLLASTGCSQVLATGPSQKIAASSFRASRTIPLHCAMTVSIVEPNQGNGYPRDWDYARLVHQESQGPFWNLTYHG